MRSGSKTKDRGQNSSTYNTPTLTLARLDSFTFLLRNRYIELATCGAQFQARQSTRITAADAGQSENLCFWKACLVALTTHRLAAIIERNFLRIYTNVVSAGQWRRVDDPSMVTYGGSGCMKASKSG